MKGSSRSSGKLMSSSGLLELRSRSRKAILRTTALMMSRTSPVHKIQHSTSSIPTESTTISHTESRRRFEGSPRFWKGESSSLISYQGWNGWSHSSTTTSTAFWLMRWAQGKPSKLSHLYATSWRPKRTTAHSLSLYLFPRSVTGALSSINGHLQSINYSTKVLPRQGRIWQRL